MDYIEITKEEAKDIYCKNGDVYVSNKERQYWHLPPSYAYNSHAPIEELFYRSCPSNEGENRFFKEAK